MQKEEIINELKAQYSRELRKQLVKTLLSNEKEQDKTAADQQYKLINQIFSYVIQASEWSMSPSSENWDNTPLEIMAEVFPKLSTTQWYQEQEIMAKKNIDVVLSSKK
jgi:hypothetical protein